MRFLLVRHLAFHVFGWSKRAPRRSILITGLSVFAWTPNGPHFFVSHSTIPQSDFLTWFFWKLCVRQSILILVVWRACIFRSKICICKPNWISTFFIFRVMRLAEMLAVWPQERHFCVCSDFLVAQKTWFLLIFKIDDTSNRILPFLIVRRALWTCVLVNPHSFCLLELLSLRVLSLRTQCA